MCRTPGTRAMWGSTAAGRACSATRGASSADGSVSAGGDERRYVAAGLVEEEASHHDGLLQLPLAHVGLVEQILHHFQHDAGLVAVQLWQRRARIELCAEQHALHLGEDLRGDARKVTHRVELIEQPQLPGLAEVSEHRLSGAPG